MTESVQRILKRRALYGQYLTTLQDIITWLEATARGWNADPTPFYLGWQPQAAPPARRHFIGGTASDTKVRCAFAALFPDPFLDAHDD